MDNLVRYGMVGGGMGAFIGDVHRKALGFDTRARLTAGCFSTNGERNRETADAYCLNASRLYENYGEMAKSEAVRDDGIDLVSIVTPNHLHYEIAKTFLESGIHVVCEKPLCFEVGQAEELVGLAEKKRLLFGVTYAYTGYTMVKVMKEMIAEGHIGDIVSINAEYAQEWLIDELDEYNPGASKLSVWRTDPYYAGVSNCVGDIGSHIENMVSYVTGLKIKRLLACVNTFGKSLDMNANILLEYENGVNGAYWCSQVAAGRHNGMMARIYGSRGSLEWEQHFPDYLRFTPKNKPTQILSRGAGYITENAASYSRIPAGHPEGLYVGFANIYKNIITAILKLGSGEPPTSSDLDYPTAREGLDGVKFIHAVIDSAKNDSAWISM